MSPILPSKRRPKGMGRVNRLTWRRGLITSPLWPKDGDWCWVYFARTGDFIKIGATGGGRLAIRLRALQGYNPLRLSLWYAAQFEWWHDAHAFEIQTHRQLEPFRHRGEWFRITPEVVRFVRNLRRQARARSEAA